jgi:uncharacterized protein (DUF486 family)
MLQSSPIETIAHLIQLSVAPVFLIAGIGSMLAVMTNRLGRIVDRARVLEEMQPADTADWEDAERELGTLSRRAKLINISISLCTTTALLVATVIAILFLGAFVSFDASMAVALIFVAAMLMFITAMLLFLREVSLAIASLQLGKRRVKRPGSKTLP